MVFYVLLLDFVTQVLKSWRWQWIIRQCGLLIILVKNTNLILIFPREINAVPCYCSREASSEQEPQLTRASFWDRQAAAFYRNREQSFCLFLLRPFLEKESIPFLHKFMDGTNTENVSKPNRSWDLSEIHFLHCSKMKKIFFKRNGYIWWTISFQWFWMKLKNLESIACISWTNLGS